MPGYGFLLNNELTDFNYDSTDAPEPRRRRQAPAQLDGAHDHRAQRQAVHGDRLAGRLDDPRHGAGDARQPGRPQASRCRTPSPLPRAVERNTASTQAEQSFIDSRQGQDLLGLGYKYITPDDTDTIGATPEIGAATGVEFRSGKRFTAAAEPARRGGGSAGVVR